MATEELSDQQQAELAHEIEGRVKETLGESRASLWPLSEALHEFNEMRGWLKLGYEHVSEWLADPEISLPSSTFYRLVKTWDKLVVQRKVKPGRLKELEQSKVAIVVGKIADGTATVDEALADAKVMGARDLREKYLAPRPAKEAKAEPEDDDDSPNVESDDDDDSAIGQNPPQGDDDEVADAEVVLRPMRLGDLVQLAAKRWHRKPEAEQIIDWLEAEGLFLVDVEALPRDEVEEVLSSGAANPRVSREALETLRMELWGKTTAV